MRKTTLILLCAFLARCASQLQVQLIIYEPFNYTLGTTSNDPDGALNGGIGLPATNTGGNPTGTSTGLRNAWGESDQIVAVLTYSNSGGARLLTARQAGLMQLLKHGLVKFNFIEE